MTVESFDAYRTLHQSFEGSQIMVVEDNSTERNILQRLLENFGFTVTAVTSGEEALHRLNSGQYAPYAARCFNAQHGWLGGAQSSKAKVLSIRASDHYGDNKGRQR